jgi:hypothetical protein
MGRIKWALIQPIELMVKSTRESLRPNIYTACQFCTKTLKLRFDLWYTTSINKFLCSTSTTHSSFFVWKNHIQVSNKKKRLRGQSRSDRWCWSAASALRDHLLFTSSLRVEGSCSTVGPTARLVATLMRKYWRILFPIENQETEHAAIASPAWLGCLGHQVGKCPAASNWLPAHPRRAPTCIGLV